MEENNNTTTSTKGKGLGTAGMVIGIVAIVWAIIPLVGAAAWWLALVGLVLSVVAFFMAKKNNNPKKGMMLTGIILNFVALLLAIFWIYKIMHAASELKNAFEHSGAMDSLNKAMETLKELADTTQAH